MQILGQGSRRRAHPLAKLPHRLQRLRVGFVLPPRAKPAQHFVQPLQRLAVATLPCQRRRILRRVRIAPGAAGAQLADHGAALEPAQRPPSRLRGRPAAADVVAVQRAPGEVGIGAAQGSAGFGIRLQLGGRVAERVDLPLAVRGERERDLLALSLGQHLRQLREGNERAESVRHVDAELGRHFAALGVGRVDQCWQLLGLLRKFSRPARGPVLACHETQHMPRHVADGLGLNRQVLRRLAHRSKRGFVVAVGVWPAQF